MFIGPDLAENIIAAVDAVAVELLVEVGWPAPPVDALALASEHLGITVCLDPNQPNRGRALRSSAGRLIYLRPEPRAERLHWAAAHEIGEHLLGRFAAKLDEDLNELPPGFSEYMANLFAGRLLVPSHWFVTDARRLRYDLIALKHLYATASHEVIAWRLLDLPRACVVSIVDDNRLTRRRSNAWDPPRTLLPIEVRCQRYVHQTGQPGLLREDGWTIQGWPIHEAATRREILRSAWDD